MTFRAKPVVKRSHRPNWESRDRRNFYTNIGFGIVVVAAIVILVATAAFSWYDDHFGSVATVNGETITKDQFRERFRAESGRLGIAEARIRTDQNAGRLTAAQAQSQLEFIGQRRQQLAAITLEQMIDARILSVLGGQEGISVTDAQIDEALIEEATTPELRHAWIIEIEPGMDAGADEPTAEQRAEARKKAEDARAEIEGGASWEDVAKRVSTDTTAPTGGDLGWITAEASGLDQAFLDALFALESAGLTEVLEGEDDVFRIGRVSEIAPESVDAGYELQLTDQYGVDLAVYREMLRTDLIRRGLEEKVVAEVSKPSVQRRVSEIYIAAPQTPPGEGAVKVRHILYSPKDDPNGARTLPQDDPAWSEAEQEARATYEQLQRSISNFDRIARTESDEGSAVETGGKLPYFDPESGLDESFADAIFKEGLEPGQLLEPVKSAFGWHVIQVMYYPPDLEQAKRLKAELDGGASFRAIARDFSDAASASDGGERGWVARGQVEDDLEIAIFGAEVGKLSDPVEIQPDGVYLLLVHEQATRAPEGDQLEQLKSTAFSDWYAAKKAGFTIVRAGSTADLAP